MLIFVTSTAGVLLQPQYNNNTAGLDAVDLLPSVFICQWLEGCFPAGLAAVNSWQMPSYSCGTVLLCPSLFHHQITVNELCLWKKLSADTPSGLSMHHYMHQFSWKQSLNHCHMSATTHRKTVESNIFQPAGFIHRKKWKVCLFFITGNLATQNDPPCLNMLNILN